MLLQVFKTLPVKLALKALAHATALGNMTSTTVSNMVMWQWQSKAKAPYVHRDWLVVQRLSLQRSTTKRQSKGLLILLASSRLQRIAAGMPLILDCRFVVHLRSLPCSAEGEDNVGKRVFLSRAILDTVGDRWIANVSDYARYSVPSTAAALGHVVVTHHNRPGGIDNITVRTNTRNTLQQAA